MKTVHPLARDGERRPAGTRTSPVRSSLRALAAFAFLVLSMGCQVPRWPVQGPLRSPFGLRLMGLRPDLHRGVDVSAATGTPVHPVLDGRVRFAGVMSGYGSVIWVDHGESLLTLYAHLSEVQVRAGQTVSQRDVIGRTGMSGNAQAPHLHLEIWRWGREVDPVPFLGGRPPGP